MAKRRKGARTPQQKKFKKVAKAAQSKCIRESSTTAAYKRCMSSEMSKGLGKRRRRRR